MQNARVRNTTIRLDPRLTEQARQGGGLPADAPISAVVRYALAKLAGLPDAIAGTIARTEPQEQHP